MSQIELPVICVTRDAYAREKTLAEKDKRDTIRRIAKSLGVADNPVAVFRECMKRHNGTPCSMVDVAAERYQALDLPDYVIVTLMRIGRAKLKSA